MTQVTRCANKIRQIWSTEDISTTVTLALTEVATLFNARILQTSILTTITTAHPEWWEIPAEKSKFHHNKWEDLWHHLLLAATSNYVGV